MTKPITRDEFIADSMRGLHDALLVGGSDKMRAHLKVMVLPSYVQWMRDNGWTVTPPEEVK